MENESIKIKQSNQTTEYGSAAQKTTNQTSVAQGSKPKTTKLRREDETLCWYCKRCSFDFIMKDALVDTLLKNGEIPSMEAFSGRIDKRPCAWFSEEKPVEGWVAEKTILTCGDSSYDRAMGQEPDTMESYKVKACPLFKPDKYAKAYRMDPRDIAKLLCVSYRLVRQIPAVSRATVMHFIDYVNTWLYGKDPLEESIKADGTYSAIRELDAKTLVQLELKAVKRTYEEALMEFDFVKEDGYAEGTTEYDKAADRVKNALLLHKNIRFHAKSRVDSGAKKITKASLEDETPLTYKSERRVSVVD